MNNNKTFKYSIPARVFMENGGNIMKATILLENNIQSYLYKVETRVENILNLDLNGFKQKIHLDMCWVIVDIILPE